MKKINKTEQCFCKSYYDGQTDTVKDCTCGKCADLVSKKEYWQMFDMSGNPVGKQLDREKLKEILSDIVTDMYEYGHFISRRMATDLVNEINNL